MTTPWAQVSTSHIHHRPHPTPVFPPHAHSFMGFSRNVIQRPAASAASAVNLSFVPRPAVDLCAGPQKDAPRSLRPRCVFTPQEAWENTDLAARQRTSEFKMGLLSFWKRLHFFLLTDRHNRPHTVWVSDPESAHWATFEHLTVTTVHSP